MALSIASRKKALLSERLGILGIGLAVMFGPTFFELLYSGAWTEPENSHGPLIFAVSIWLLWKRSSSWSPSLDNPRGLLEAWACFFIASLIYVPGRALHLQYLEVFAFICAVTGCVLLVGGVGLLKRVWFPLTFMLFMVPLPNFIVSHISSLLKQAVSAGAVDVLAWINMPVAQSGVIISIGQYELFVADACAGMSTLFVLETLGILYMYLVKDESRLRNIVLPVLIVPISFSANVVRVVALALITLYFGEETGEGFLHGFAGILLFLVGLSIMLCADFLLRLTARHIRSK